MSLHHIKPNRKRSKEGHLSDIEKSHVKKLLDIGYIAQDIQFIVGQGRITTINSRCISEVKNDTSIISSSDSEVEQYLLQQSSYHCETGLNPYVKEHKRLLKAREAMLSAVQAFNNPIAKFKSEQFCVLSQIAWTALIQEWFVQNKSNYSLYESNGDAKVLGKLLKHNDLPLTDAKKANILKIKDVRDIIEHDISHITDAMFGTLYNANLLNFNEFLITHFGEHLSLGSNLAFALQFGKITKNDVIEFEKYNVPENIRAVYNSMISDDNYDNAEYAFSVFYGKVSASKANANMVYALGDDESEETIKMIFDEENKFMKKYPMTYSDLVNKLKQYENFKQNNDFKKIKGVLEGNEELAGRRYLNPRNKKGTKKFYNQKMLDAIVEEMGLTK